MPDLDAVTMPDGEQYIRPAVVIVWTWDGLVEIRSYADPHDSASVAPPPSSVLAQMRRMLADFERDGVFVDGDPGWRCE